MSFLYEKVKRNALIRVAITGAPAAQQFTAIVEEVYSARDFEARVGSEIRFVGKPPHWGQRSLAVGQRALLFIRRISGMWYEDAWEGDLPIEEIDGAEYALYRAAYERVLTFDSLPDSLKVGCRPHPTLPMTTCFNLATLEFHLNSLIDRVYSEGGMK
ncbi:hypothetical protein ACIGZJ_21275 [Kitasatospora sp. NPDC052868]|uniref:hypothetical protein n=1 Tax=Kitasatospora sp. NPDC052868 TaxID=3364060 RepID=UPI0037C8D5A5